MMPLNWMVNPFTPEAHGDAVGKIFREHMDNVNSPKHYTSHPSGVECISITEHYNFCIGNAIKYLWRAGLKSDASLEDKQKEIEDLRKAIWYINRQISNLEKQ
jgi:hypothetical protein